MEAKAKAATRHKGKLFRIDEVTYKPLPMGRLFFAARTGRSI